MIGYPKCADKNSQEDLGFGNWFLGVCLVGLDTVIIGLEGRGWTEFTPEVAEFYRRCFLYWLKSPGPVRML